MIFYTKFLIRDPSATDGVLPQVTECESVIKQIAKSNFFEALRKSSNYISEYNNQDELCNTSSSALNNKGQVIVENTVLILN